MICYIILIISYYIILYHVILCYIVIINDHIEYRLLMLVAMA